MSATLSDDQRASILEDLDFRFKGAGNSGRPLLLEGDFEYVSGVKMRKARKIKNFKQDLDVNKKLFEVAKEFVA